MRHYKLIVIGCILILLSCKSTKENNTRTSTNKNNVLFIMVDDLRPELNIYGQSQIISPNIDWTYQVERIVFQNSY